MAIRLFQRRTIWCPTLLGWAALLLTCGSCAALWCFRAESFLAQTQRLPADALVVESWIGIQGVEAAKAEFDRGGYRYIIAAGGLSGNRWGRRQWNLAVEAEELLLRLGLSRDQVILAPSEDVQSQRTFASAIAVSRTLQRRGIRLKAINVFTLNVHARRSRLVYAKVLPAGVEVGVISWMPPDYFSGPWWQSSERTLDLLKETVGYTFEACLNSGRLSNAATPPSP